MNLFKTFTLKWWQAGLFKVMLISLGILVGSAFPGVFLPLRALLFALFIFPTVYICWIWWKQ